MRIGAPYLSSFVFLNQNAVDTLRGASRRQPQDEWALRSGSKVVDAVDDVVGDIGTGGGRIVADDEPHVGLRDAWELKGGGDV
jgi:hypothetical protein